MKNLLVGLLLLPLSELYAQSTLFTSMKTIQDSVFAVGDTIRIPNVFPFHLHQPYSDFEQSNDSLLLLATFLNEHSQFTFSLSCHTDQRGTESMNLHITQEKAKAIKQNLLPLLADTNQIIAFLGKGETEPRIPLEIIEKEEKGQKRELLYRENRRTQLIIIKER